MDILELLDKRGIEYKKTNNPYEVLIKCTSGLHDDKNASLSFNTERGIFNCWSCGFKGGISKFLKSIGEVQAIDFDSKEPYKLKKLKDKLENLSTKDEIRLPDDRRVFQDEFRGISSTTYRQFNAFTTNQYELTDYVCFPVYQHGRLRFIEGRFTGDLANQPKYYRRPAKAKVTDVMFPLDKIRHTNYVILVEGIYDMLNMWDNGFSNTLCIFGASNFTKRKAEILDHMGITRVDIMMDSDAAGVRAAEKIAELLDSRNIYARIITLPPGVDPGELTKEQAERLLR